MDIKSCPFCGETQGGLKIIRKTGYSIVKCDGCGAKGPKAFDGAIPPPALAVYKWNERVDVG